MMFEVDFDEMVDYIYTQMTLAGNVVNRDTILKVLDYETAYILEAGLMGDEEQ